MNITSKYYVQVLYYCRKAEFMQMKVLCMLSFNLNVQKHDLVSDILEKFVHVP